jgi:hypothetical protein
VSKQNRRERNEGSEGKKRRGDRENQDGEKRTKRKGERKIYGRGERDYSPDILRNEIERGYVLH